MKLLQVLLIAGFVQAKLVKIKATRAPNLQTRMQEQGLTKRDFTINPLFSNESRPFVCKSCF
jgi:hypothetical protein